MKLRLTIQELEDKDTKEKFQGLFGTLTTTFPDKKGKLKPQDINFMTRVDAVEGLEDIVQNLIVEALALKKADTDQKDQAIDKNMDAIEKGETAQIIMPNREMRRKVEKINRKKK